MKRKIYWNMCLTALFTIVVSALLITMIHYRSLEEQMRREVMAEARYAESALELSGDAYLEALSGKMRGSKYNRITVIGADGSVEYDNYADSASMENHADRPEIQQALSLGAGQSKRASSTLSEQTYYYAIRLSDGRVLRVAATTGSILSVIIRTVPWMLGIAVLIMIFAMLLAQRQTANIVEPINRLNPDAPEAEKLYDELSPLVRKLEQQKQMIRKQMDILQEKQQEFTAITENMNEGFIVVDSKADVISFNTSAVKILGVDIEGVEGGSRNVLSLNRSSSFRQAVDTALQGEKNEQTLRMNGRSYHLIANPVEETSERRGAVVVILDVTEQENREEMRREFSANVSHELKTPLTSISGYAEIMKNHMVKAEDAPRFAEKIYTEAQRLITLVEDIIRLSRLDESDVELEKTAVDLYSIASAVVGRLGEQAERLGISLNLKGESTEVQGVMPILDEMIFNLCENAVKYNHPQGSVTVFAGMEDGHPTVSVTDTGIGIAEADKERIFERFYRVDKSHSKQIGGTGLGLSIVKHGAMFHGAQVKLDSVLGKGTTVKVIF